MKALLYCTKGMPALFYDVISKQYMYGIDTPKDRFSHRLNGKIVAEVEIGKVEEIKLDRLDLLEEICKKSCLSHSELYEYLADFHIESNCMFYKKGYALHLTNLKVFDKPKVLFEYDVKPRANITYSCTDAPQNMCNVYDSKGNHYILISIQPQHLCRILNGGKTIVVRRKVLNCLKEMCKDE